MEDNYKIFRAICDTLYKRLFEAGYNSFDQAKKAHLRTLSWKANLEKLSEAGWSLESQYNLVSLIPDKYAEKTLSSYWRMIEDPDEFIKQKESGVSFLEQIADNVTALNENIRGDGIIMEDSRRKYYAMVLVELKKASGLGFVDKLHAQGERVGRSIGDGVKKSNE